MLNAGRDIDARRRPRPSNGDPFRPRRCICAKRFISRPTSNSTRSTQRSSPPPSSQSTSRPMPSLIPSSSLRLTTFCDRVSVLTCTINSFALKAFARSAAKARARSAPSEPSLAEMMSFMLALRFPALTRPHAEVSTPGPHERRPGAKPRFERPLRALDGPTAGQVAAFPCTTSASLRASQASTPPLRPRRWRRLRALSPPPHIVSLLAMFEAATVTVFDRQSGECAA